MTQSEEDMHELWEERAAILEFDGGFSRKVAEMMATRELGYGPYMEAL